MNYRIRKLEKTEYGCLEEFLYDAIFVPEGVEPPPREIVALPELQVYTAHFGEEKDDMALAAEANGRVVGVVWARVMEDYGHIDGNTPSLAISLLPTYRGQGIGTALLREMLALLRENGYGRVSLSVQEMNYAAEMYRKAGFRVWEEKEGEMIMVKDLE